MKTVSSTEFRRNASAVLDLVERGQRVRVVRHGKPVATIVPEGGTDTAPAWRGPGLRLKVSSGASLAKAVLEERRSGR
jgi:prevent-host-death family protein